MLKVLKIFLKNKFFILFLYLFVFLSPKLSIFINFSYKKIFFDWFLLEKEKTNFNEASLSFIYHQYMCEKKHNFFRMQKSALSAFVRNCINMDRRERKGNPAAHWWFLLLLDMASNREACKSILSLQPVEPFHSN